MNVTGRTVAKIDQIRQAGIDRWEAAWELIRATDRIRLLAGGGPNDQRAFADIQANYGRAAAWYRTVTRRG